MDGGNWTAVLSLRWNIVRSGAVGRATRCSTFRVIRSGLLTASMQ